MDQGAWEGELREAIEELQAYLSDQVAPLLVVDSVKLLLAQPPALLAEALRGWGDGQLRGPAQSLALGDYLFHAVKKVQLFGRLKLVDPEALAARLAEVVEHLVARAPAADQAVLRAMLQQAMAVESSFAPSAQRLYRPAGATTEPACAAPSQALGAEVAASVRQFALLLDRLGAARSGAGGAAASAELAPQLLAAAAQSANSQGELEQHLARLSKAGLMAQVRLGDVFATLGQGVPNWWLGEGENAAAPASAALQAMHRIVSLSASPEQTRAQFRELFKTAAQQLNGGSLARAVQVLDVARRLLAEGKVDKTSADLILGTAHEDLDATQLMKLATQPASQPLLRRLLGAYPALTPAGLLLALDDEPDRARRRLWLTLLEAHGTPARQAALERLERSLEDPAMGPFAAWRQRNFLYLLHRIRPPVGDDPQLEIRLCARFADLAGPAPLVREAVVDLGLRRHPDAEAALRAKLEQLERLLELPPGSALPHDPPELRRMLGLVVTGLARQGTPSALRLVVDHALRNKAALGDTLERVEELAAHDLSGDPELVERLLAALRAQLPVRVLGVNLRRAEGAHHLLRALAGTRSPAVERALVDVARRFAAEELGQVASGVLAAWQSEPAAAPGAEPQAPGEAPAPAAPTPSLAGDLEAFGLPELLQTLSQTQSSGRLVLRDRNGGVVGELLLHEGTLRAARVRDLPLPDAFYELVEVPQAGTFEFTRQVAAAIPAGPSRDLMALVMEGMRRYDELQRARAVAPDHGFLHATGTRPTPPGEDADGGFVRALWTAVKDGATPKQCEEAVAADSYRIRTALAHWLEEGALELREAAADAPP